MSNQPSTIEELAGEVITETYTEPQEVHVEEPQAKRSKTNPGKDTSRNLKAKSLFTSTSQPSVSSAPRQALPEVVVATKPTSVQASDGMGFLATLKKNIMKENKWVRSTTILKGFFSGVAATAAEDVQDATDVIVFSPGGDVCMLLKVVGTGPSGKTLQPLGTSEEILLGDMVLPWTEKVNLLTAQFLDALLQAPSSFTWFDGESKDFALRSVKYSQSSLVTLPAREQTAVHSSPLGLSQSLLDTVEQAAGCTTFCGRPMVKHGLMGSVLAVLSAAPERCLRQGINSVYQTYIALGYQTLLQPCYIAAFALTCNPALDLNIFAPLGERYSASEAQKRRAVRAL